ncbi:MAG: tRNA (N6-isopentenyl adenosine(37)-C2)-methylthiotransferase MiaB [Chloroflexaceae bacterium]|nr:tRNA (N6-isopentenyl adenosine(37)-C2)-methylthiotransferase MiaB [Chloroflexaceae bacterium]
MNQTHATIQREIVPRSQRYYVWTIGCQMNVSDSERLEAALQQAGYCPSERPEEAGFIVLNSCSVRASAEQRIIGKLGELQRVKRQHPDTRIVLWGCMVGPGNESIFRERLPMVDHFISPSVVEEVVALAPLLEHPPEQPSMESPVLPIRSGVVPPVSVAVPIQYGCNMTCSYCIIPLRRGRERSRPLETIVQEVQRLVVGGTREIILLGQIVDSWGHDLPGRPDLSTLLAAVHATPGLSRLRFLTSHPAWMSDRLIDTVASLPRCQPEMNLPVQAGHDEMLKRMRRGYTLDRYRSLVRAIRTAIPNMAITTDIIVGHPGETRDHFEQTLAFVQEMRFDKIHLAAFSPRPGTLAAVQEADPALAVPDAEKQERRRILEYHQKAIASDINARLAGQTVEILVEGKARGKWYGRTGTNKLVFFEHPGAWAGQVIEVGIIWTGPWSLQGKLEQATGTGSDNA